MARGISKRSVEELVDIMADYQACKLKVAEIESKYQLSTDGMSRLRRLSVAPVRKSIGSGCQKITLKSDPVPMSVLRKRIQAAIDGNKLSQKNQDVFAPVPQKMASVYHRTETETETETASDAGRKLPEFPDIKNIWDDYRPPAVRGRL